MQFTSSAQRASTVTAPGLPHACTQARAHTWALPAYMGGPADGVARDRARCRVYAGLGGLAELAQVDQQAEQQPRTIVVLARRGR